MDVDFDSPVNIDRPPAPLSFSPDSHEPPLPSSPPPSTMPLPNHQHNSQHQLSQPSLQLQQVQQVHEAPASATTTDTTAPDRPALSNDAEPTPQLDGASAGETNSAAQAPVDDNAMDTTPDNDTTANRPNDTPVDANPDSSQQTSTSESQPPPSTDNPTENTVAAPAPADPEQPPAGSEVPQPPQTIDPNQNQAVAGNADVDEFEEDDSSSDVSDDQGNDKPQEEHAYWADFEEDTSSPNEEELKEIAENAERQYNAHECEFLPQNHFGQKKAPLTLTTR